MNWERARRSHATQRCRLTQRSPDACVSRSSAGAWCRRGGRVGPFWRRLQRRYADADERAATRNRKVAPSRRSKIARRVRWRAPAKPVVRFEPPAGWQGQVDFGEFRLPWGRRHALMVVLGYSRLLCLRFHPRQTMDALFAGLEEAFGRFGGFPHDELMFDLMRGARAPATAALQAVAIRRRPRRQPGSRLVSAFGDGRRTAAKGSAGDGDWLSPTEPDRMRQRTLGLIGQRPNASVRQVFNRVQDDLRQRLGTQGRTEAALGRTLHTGNIPAALGGALVRAVPA